MSGKPGHSGGQRDGAGRPKKISLEQEREYGVRLGEVYGILKVVAVGADGIVAEFQGQRLVIYRDRMLWQAEQELNNRGVYVWEPLPSQVWSSITDTLVNEFAIVPEKAQSLIAKAIRRLRGRYEQRSEA